MNDIAADLNRSLDADNPWPGLMPFTEATQAFFHGRDSEAAELLRRARRQRLTTFRRKKHVFAKAALEFGRVR